MTPCRAEAPVLERGWREAGRQGVLFLGLDSTTGIPETFFISARGQVVGHVIGAITSGQLRDGVAAARSGRPAQATEGGDRRLTR